MHIKIEYDDIFFGRYDISQDKKQFYAEYICKKAFSEIAESENVTIEFLEDEAELTAKYCIKEELVFKRLRSILIKEFYIVLSQSDVIIPEKTHDLAEEVRTYINKNYVYDTLNSSSIADYFKEPKDKIERILVADKGMTTTQFIKNKRVEKAKKMLLEGMSVKDCSELCGFGSEKTMCRAFKSIYGVSPGEVKQKKS